MPTHRLALTLLLACACARVQPRTTEPAASQPAAAASQPRVIPAEATRRASGPAECMLEHTGTPGQPPLATHSRVVRETACNAHGGERSRTDAHDTEGMPSATPPADALHTESGLSYVVLTPGTGTEHPGAGAHIRAHYIGWTASDLAMFDSSYERGEPIDFQAEHVIKGWGEAVPRMVVGETIRLWIPEALAYQGQPNLPAGMLIFDIELISFTPGS